MIILKPQTLNMRWATDGQKIQPADTKILSGWAQEIPPHQWFNWILNRADEAIAHINQRGIAEWDSFTEYQANRSYVQGSNGVIYKCILTNTDNDPTDPFSIFWREAFLSTDSETASNLFVGYSVQNTDFSAIVNTRYYLTGPVTVYLPANPGIGDNVALNKLPIIQPTVRANTGQQIRTSLGLDTTVTYDVDDQINFVFDGTYWSVI